MRKIEINILIVEDNDAKYNVILSKFTKHNQNNEKVKYVLTRAASCFSALSIYKENYYDLVILDLKLPLNDGSQESFNVENSKEVYEYIKNSKDSSPFLIVGLTALAEEEYEGVFAENEIFSIQKYNDTKWFEKLIERFDFISNGRVAFTNFLLNNFNLDVIILVAREKNEYKPILEYIPWVLDNKMSDPRLGIRKNTFGKIELENGKILTVGLVCLGEMGLSISASYASQLLHLYRPKYFAMLGMCCGFLNLNSGKNIKLGDIIIARNTANWDEGKYEEGVLPLMDDPFYHLRSIERFPGEDILEQITQFLESNEDKVRKDISSFYKDENNIDVISGVNSIEGIEFNLEPKVHFDLMLSGSSVIDSLRKLDEIKARFSTAVALEMEAHSIYSAVNCLIGKKPKAIVIKGVADQGASKEETKAIQAIASTASYILFQQLLSSLE